MKLITRQMKVAEELADWDRWNAAYLKEPDRYAAWVSGGQKEKYKQLVALGNNPAPDDVDRILRLPRTRLSCHECDEECEAVMEMGEPNDYESATACLCLSCVQKAAALLAASSGTKP